MTNIASIIMSTIGQLSSLEPARAATFEDLATLHAARESIDELFRAYSDELASGEATSSAWEAVAAAIGSASQPPHARLAAPSAAGDVAARRVATFWSEHAQKFQWDFLPVGFLHALYASWMEDRFAKELPLSQHGLTRRLKALLYQSSQWSHVRSRPGALMAAHEPLVPAEWSHDGTDAAIYGFRRISSM